MRQKKLWFALIGILAVLVMALMLPTAAGAASKYKALYRFKGAPDGASPRGGLIFDLAGNLYGTTQFGGKSANCGNCGTVFKLTPNSNGSWTEKVIYDFCSRADCADGAGPQASLSFDTSGNLYGTTQTITNIQQGVVFELVPNHDGSWTEKVLHTFTDSPDGSNPAGLIFDTAGNLYGTTEGGGVVGGGTVFELTPNSDGSWTESLLYSFTRSPDGAFPVAGVILDAAGNLYGTTAGGGRFRIRHRV